MKNFKFYEILGVMHQIVNLHFSYVSFEIYKLI